MRIFIGVLLSTLLCPFLLFSQQLIKGQVLDTENEPLIGVNILIKDSDQGTITDPNGNFEIANGNFEIVLEVENQVLVFSYLGYQTKEIIPEANALQIQLSEEVTVLETAVIKGFKGNVGFARRRSASTQKIPESIVTLTGTEIQSTGINNIQSFANLVPNVSFNTSQSVGVNFINIRGIPQIRNGDAPVTFVIDGVTIPDPNLLNQELYDLAMIEVVKGPQGTLYGKNAIGGAINILTNAPSNITKNKVVLGYGNGSSFKSILSSTGAIVKDKVYFRIAGSYRNTEGFFDNETLNQKVDANNSVSLRGQLKFDFNPTFTATLTGQISDAESGAVYWAHAPEGLQLDANDFNSVINADVLGKAALDNQFASLKLEKSLGKAKFKSVTSFNSADRIHTGDLDFLPSDILRQEQESNTRTFNQEFRLSSTLNSKLSWETGLFFQNSKKDLITKVFADFGYFTDPVAPTGELVLTNFVEARPLSDFTNEYKTIAGFVFADYQLTDKLTFSGGLRFDNDRIRQVNRNDARSPERTDNKFQPKLSLAYQASKNTLLFANYGKGYRNAGYNAQSTDFFDEEYEAETTDNFELGLKTSSKNQRLIFNLSGFYIDFDNQQQYVVALGANGLLLGNFNFPKSEVYGFESDLKYRMNRYFDVMAGYGLNLSTIKEGGQTSGFDRSVFNGNNTPFVPQTSYMLALQSHVSLNERVDFTGFINLHGKGKIYWAEDNLDVANPYSLLDARIGLTIDKKIDLAIWGNNLTNKKYYQEYFAGELSGSAAGDIAWKGQPISYGIEVGFRL